MAIKILYILPSYNKFGGTPKKTLDLIKYSQNNCFLYVWTNAYANEFKHEFINSGAFIYEGNHGKNVVKHIRHLVQIVNKHSIQIVQSQFFFGELLAGCLKLLRPNIKLIIAFVGSVSPSGFKKIILKLIYKKADAFVYISNYVKKEKRKTFPILVKAVDKIIYNGTTEQLISKNHIPKSKNKITILCVSGLSKIKNIQVLIECMSILLERKYNNVRFLIAGDGPERNSLKNQIIEKKLTKNITLLGYYKNIGALHEMCDIFVHPCYIEGFGIAVAEAMISEKPIIASNSGALPELIQQNKTGILVNPFIAEEWSNAIIKIIKDPIFSKKIATSAKQYAKINFSVEKFVANYHNLYQNILD